jgi:hypothetical protein
MKIQIELKVNEDEAREILARTVGGNIRLKEVFPLVKAFPTSMPDIAVNSCVPLTARFIAESEHEERMLGGGYASTHSIPRLELELIQDRFVLPKSRLV